MKMHSTFLSAAIYIISNILKYIDKLTQYQDEEIFMILPMQEIKEMWVIY